MREDVSEPLDPFVSRARVRALVEQLPVVVYVDSDDRWARSLYLSPRVQDLLGHAPEAFIADRELWPRSIHPDDRQLLREVGERSWTEGTPFRAEYRMIRADGAEVWLRDTAELLVDAGGRRLAWQGVIEDITAEKRSEQELRASEARYRALVERVPAVVYEMGPDDERRTLFVSPHVEEVLGYTRAEWLDQPDIWIELLHADDREHVLARHDAHSQTGDPWDLEYRLIASDGRVLWVNDRATLIRGADDRPQAWHGVILDVTAEHDVRSMLELTNEELERRVVERTGELEEANELMALEIGERRRIEHELREARERYRRLVDNMPGIAYVWEVGRDGEPHRLSYVSQRVEEILGFRADEWIRLASEGSPAARVHPHDRAAVMAAQAESARTGRPFLMEYRCLGKDGRIVWILDNASLFARSDDGRPLAFQGVIVDITARKVAESKAAQAEDRLRSLTEGGPFVAFAYELTYREARTQPEVAIRYVSPQLAELVGYPLDVVTDPVRWFEIVHPDDRDRVAAHAVHVWRTGDGWAIRYRVIRSDGQILWLDDTGRMNERDRDGRPWRFHGVLLDVTEIEESSAHLHAVASATRATIEGARALPWAETIDRKTGAERYTFIGPQSLEILGYTPQELIAEPTHFSRMVHPDDREQVARSIERADLLGHWENDYRVISRDGSIRWLHSVGRRVSEPGADPETWHGVAIDVTPLRSSEEGGVGDGLPADRATTT